MNYDLAKRLKDAGFPQSGWGNRIHPNGNFTDKNVPQPEPDTCYVPTLSELIEACGGKKIGEHEFMLTAGEEDKWWASYGTFDVPVWLTSGSTPEEAVAELWLALNTK